MAGEDLSAEARASLARVGVANARTSGCDLALADALHIVATGWWWSGKDFASRKEDMEEALAIVERSGSQIGLANSVNAMGRVYWWEKMWADAEPWLVRAAEMARTLHRCAFHFMFDLAVLYLDMRQPHKARPHLKEAFVAVLSVETPRFICDGLQFYGRLAGLERKYERSAILYAAWMANPDQ